MIAALSGVSCRQSKLQHADAPHPFGLLRARRKRPRRRRAAEQRDELAPLSFDHLVGELLQIERHLEAKHLGGREIDDEIELRGPLDRQVARPLTLENAGGVDANPVIAIGGAGAVAHQTAGRRELAKVINDGDRMAYRERGDLIAPAGEERIGTDD